MLNHRNHSGNYILIRISKGEAPDKVRGLSALSSDYHLMRTIFFVSPEPASSRR